MLNKEQSFLRRWIDSELTEKQLPPCTDKELIKFETGYFVFYHRERNCVSLARQKALFDLIEMREKNE